MPTILKLGKFRIEIRTNDHSPAHVHIFYRNESECKIEIESGRIIKNKGFSERELNILKNVVLKEAANFLKRWREIHADK